ncbi:hypothetical protein ABZP36_009190, partial [Zizania latifolia]
SHTIGLARCTNFRAHVYNDTNINAGFARMRQSSCPSSSGSGDNNLAPLDLQTPIVFENNYYKNLVVNKGLLHSDQELFNGGATDALVQSYVSSQSAFLQTKGRREDSGGFLFSSRLVSAEAMGFKVASFLLLLLIVTCGAAQAQHSDFALLSVVNSESTCVFCHHIIDEIVSKLKDPDSEFEIIQLLLKECNKIEGYVQQCKRMVLQYVPLVLVNGEKFLEKNDVCTLIQACDAGKRTFSSLSARKLVRDA